MEGLRLQHQMWLGQVRAALPPRGINPKALKQVLLAAADEGLDPMDLYLQAVRDRPAGYEKPPVLQTILPQELLDQLYAKMDDEELSLFEEASALAQAKEPNPRQP